MPSNDKKTISGQLNGAAIIINTTLNNTEIQAIMAEYGYPTEEIAEGQQLYEAATHAAHARAIAVSELRTATRREHEAEKEARLFYQGLVQIARAIFPPQSPQRKALKITGPMPDRTSEFLLSATTLFTNAMNVAEIAQVLAKYSYNQEKLEHGLALIAAFDAANRAQIAAQGAAKRATRAQTQALAALQKWCSLFARVARVALRDKPALLEQLGLAIQTGKPAPNGEPARVSPMADMPHITQQAA